MIDLAGLSLVLQTCRQFLYQSVVTIGGLQQQSTAIGTAFSLIKLGNDRLEKTFWEQQTLCCACLLYTSMTGHALTLGGDNAC